MSTSPTAESPGGGTTRSVLGRVDAFQRRHPVVAFPLAVVYKFFDDRGPHLAALISYYGFVSLFPLLLLFTSVLGFVLQGNEQLRQQVLDAALSNFPLLRDQLESSVGQFRGSGVALAVGVVGTLYGGLGAMQAAQAAFNRIYAVPRFAQPNPLWSRVRSLLLVVALGLGALVSTGLSAIVPLIGGAVPATGPLLPLAAYVIAFVVDTGVFLVAFQTLTARRLSWRNVLLGAVTAALLWELLQTLGVAYLRSSVGPGSSSVYGIFGVVLGLLVWIYLQAMVVVVAAEINTVRHRRLYPRALLTPFTDDVDLTASDVRVYTSYASSERYKGFERVEASFDKPDDREQQAAGATSERHRGGASPLGVARRMSDDEGPDETPDEQRRH